MAGLLEDGLKLSVLDLAQFDAVRVAISPAYSVEKRVTKNGIRMRVKRGNSSRSFDRSIFDGVVDSNTPTQGKIVITTYLFDEHIKLTVPYHAIRFILLAQPITTRVDTSINPGTKALGTSLIGGTLMPPRFNFLRLKL